ncbi:YceI family protein [Chitinophaga sp. Hz27]|uniref:YceI family protein n=1 Tax=Chitinophaga sp. Hz27 TaxID=3347169 RepID=UPI0035DAE385
MTRQITISLLLLALLAACQEAPRADKAKVGEIQAVKPAHGNAYQADTVLSVIGWIGTKPTGKHHGTLKLVSGVIYVEDTTITSARFVVDMNTMANVDLAADTAMKNKLERELKSPLFFDVSEYPTAIFEMTAITPYIPSLDDDITLRDATHTIEGNFTAKGITKNISFPAKIKISDKKVTALASFNIDRTLWGMNYRTNKSLQDKLIKSQVNISFSVVAVR